MFYAQSTGTVTSGRRCVENAELPKALSLKPGECQPAAKFSQLYFSVSEPSILFQRKNGVMTASPTCTFNSMTRQTFAVDRLGGKYRVANWAAGPNGRVAHESAGRDDFSENPHHWCLLGLLRRPLILRCLVKRGILLHTRAYIGALPRRLHRLLAGRVWGLGWPPQRKEMRGC